MNKAAVSLCLNNPQLLLKKRSELIAMARQKIIDEGFQFKKGKSRSKKGNAEPIEPKSKHQKTTHSFREKRLIEIEEKVGDIGDRITFKEKRSTECIGNSDYEKCDCLKKDIMSLKQDRRELLAEKDQLIVSNRKAAWYKKKKSSDTDSSDTLATENDPFSPISLDSDFGPFSPQDNSNPSSPGTDNSLLPLPSHVHMSSSEISSASNAENGTKHF